MFLLLPFSLFSYCSNTKYGSWYALPTKKIDYFGLFAEFVRWLSKFGTAVVTRSDGRLALGRLGALCEQVC